MESGKEIERRCTGISEQHHGITFMEKRVKRRCIINTVNELQQMKAAI